MTARTLTETATAPRTDWHGALLYRTDEEYLDGLLPFLYEGVARDEPTFVAAPGPRVDLLRSAMDGRRDQVRFADMTQLGRNPGRIIPAIRRFLDAHGGRPARFVGEPIWVGRSAAETAEATRHEALINLAFAEATAQVLCPYDVVGLEPSVLDDAHRTHPYLIEGDSARCSTRFTDPVTFCAAAAWLLPPPPPDAVVRAFGAGDLVSTRRFVRRQAEAAGLPDDRADDVELAANELVTNTLVHGAGSGQLRLWREGRSLVFEVTERGRILDPLAGRHVPSDTTPGGRGLLVTHHVCDLVELRSDGNGTTIRVRIDRSA